MPRMKTAGAKTPAAPRKTVRAKKSARSKGTFGAAMILLALVCVMGAAMVIAAHDSTSPIAAATTTASERAAVDASPAETTKPRPAAPVPVSSEPAVSTPDETPTSTAGKTAAPVTIAGCLARSGDAYQLKNATGADAPKARSWKSGFFKKGSATVDLVEAARAAKLRDHVGERVSVTGLLVDREMQVRSLRRLAPSCN